VIAYLTDVEGRWDKIEAFTAGNAHVTRDGDRLFVRAGDRFVYGGDVVDRGPAGRRVLSALIDVHRRQPEQVVLLAGNRDINKLRLPAELSGRPPARTPPEVLRGSRADLLRWILSNTMGGARAFDHRRAELATNDDERVVDSFLEDVAPGGLLREYLARARLAFREGCTLFLHGAVTAENLGRVPLHPVQRGTDAWISRLNQFFGDEIEDFVTGRSEAETLVAYQRPVVGTKLNQSSVVYGRPSDELANPQLPPADVVRTLARDGIRRVVVGHTPCGDCPAVVREPGFELVLADNSYGRVETGSQVAIDDAYTRVVGVTELDGGERAAVRFEVAMDDDETPLGRRLARTGHLVKARLARGDWLLFRGLEGYRTEQTAAPSLQGPLVLAR
jgi:hypothetical protein